MAAAASGSGHPLSRDRMVPGNSIYEMITVKQEATTLYQTLFKTYNREKALYNAAILVPDSDGVAPAGYDYSWMVPFVDKEARGVGN